LDLSSDELFSACSDLAFSISKFGQTTPTCAAKLATQSATIAAGTANISPTLLKKPAGAVCLFAQDCKAKRMTDEIFAQQTALKSRPAESQQADIC
jgi:hypothetical protein